MRIGPPERLLVLLALVRCVALDTANLTQSAVQVDYTLATRGCVQPIDILGDQHFYFAQRLEIGQRPVRGIRPRPGKVTPTDIAARPIALAGAGAAIELADLHRLGLFPFAIAIAIVRDARRRADAGATEHDDRVILRQKLAKRIDLLSIFHRVKQPTSKRCATNICCDLLQESFGMQTLLKLSFRVK